jgi:hypothetical protein
MTLWRVERPLCLADKLLELAEQVEGWEADRHQLSMAWTA